ncbi:MAG: LytTR family DNA-binding domain-containing protein [Bacteroidales bacterium]|nr:LytTR family DNA-binding domain-containing protein [Bacteroidales bacterium]
MKIKCLAIDDEPLALKQIAAYIDKTPFLEPIAFCQSAFEAIEYLTKNEIDLMFVDINMPDINGLDFVKSLEKKPQVIFTTAYSEYAIEGFQVDALDYILKPISYAVFLKAANKAKAWFELNQKQAEVVQTTQDFLFVKSEYKLIRILLSEIKYIESANEYIQIHLINNESVTTLIRLKVMEEQLPKDKFMRVHRSFIVNLDRVKVIERNRIIFDKNVYIPIGEQYKEQFQAFIDKTFLM